MTRPVVRALVPSDAENLMKLRREALEAEPLAFLASPEDDVGLDPDFVRRALAKTSQATFGAFAPDLVGMVGIARQERAKVAHKALVWGAYVSPDHRGTGLGRRLMEAALDFARRLDGVTHVHLGVAETAEAARSLYERLGFVTWGVEPDSLRVGRRSVAQRMMVLEL